MAAFTIGSMETALGRYDDALRHLREARDLAERVGGNWFAAGARVQLAILDVVRGSLDEARPQLEEALNLSLAARSTSIVTLCLAGYALLASADGDPDRAALLEGAAEGLCRRVGMRAWPHLRLMEAELAAQVRQRLECSPVRSGVLRRLRARPAGGSSHRPRPAWYRHSDAVSHHGTQRGICSLGAGAEADLAPALWRAVTTSAAMT